MPFSLIQLFSFQCDAIPGLGFRRGSYKCVCKPGFYFPDTTAEQRYYNGTEIEEEYEKRLLVSNISRFRLICSRRAEIWWRGYYQFPGCKLDFIWALLYSRKLRRIVLYNSKSLHNLFILEAFLSIFHSSFDHSPWTYDNNLKYVENISVTKWKVG